MLFNVEELMKRLGAGVASSIWKHRAEDKLTDGTTVKQMHFIIRNQNPLTASVYFQLSQYFYRTNGTSM